MSIYNTILLGNQAKLRVRNLYKDYMVDYQNNIGDYDSSRVEEDSLTPPLKLGGLGRTSLRHKRRCRGL